MPTVPFAGFIGGAYLSQAPVADGESSINLYCEKIESGLGKGGASFALYGTPGLGLVQTLPDSPLRGIWSNEASVYSVAGATLFQNSTIGSPPGPGTQISIGMVNNAASPAQIIPNGNELLIVSGGQAYDVFRDSLGVAHILAQVPAGTGTFIDGYFVVNIPFTNQFRISGINTGLTWDPLDVASKEGYPDHIVAVFAAFEQLWLFGSDTTEVWYDSGAANFPFQRIPNALLEYGCTAPYSVAKVDNSVMWLGGASFSGHGVVYQANGLLPQRVSNHALEYLIQNQYGDISDAVGYCYQDSGHTFYVLSFPSADATWVYDTTTGFWHQRGYWDTNNNQYHAALGRFHAFAFDKHFVGDYQSGNVYEMRDTFYDDNGNMIRRLRSSPHMTEQMLWTRYNQLLVDMQVGVGPQVLDPQCVMQFSDDGGLTWSNEKTASIGETGEYATRVIYRRLGRSRNRCFRIVITDPIQVAIVAAYLDANAGDGH